MFLVTVLLCWKKNYVLLLVIQTTYNSIKCYLYTKVTNNRTLYMIRDRYQKQSLNIILTELC